MTRDAVWQSHPSPRFDTWDAVAVCPVCPGDVAVAGEQAGLVALVAYPYAVRVPAADEAGVPWYGPRRGAYTKGRSSMRDGVSRLGSRPDAAIRIRTARDRRATIERGHFEQADYWGEMMPADFGTWCPACHVRIRVTLPSR